MTDQMPIDAWDHIELWVGNARQAAYFYERAYGYQPIAYCGPETGVRDRASYVLAQGDVRLVVTSGLTADSEICRFAARHGDGAKDVALTVPDAAAAYEVALERGARGVAEPYTLEDEHGEVQVASIATYGDTVHSFVTRNHYAGAYLPGFVPLDANGSRGTGVGLRQLDHVVGNVELGAMDEWVEFYERVLGFTELIHFSDEAIHTEYSALMSKVMTDGEGKIKFPINEPAEGKRKSQIEEYLEFYGGAGVQHVALLCDDIVATVEALRERGVRFLETPETYYEDATARVGRPRAARHPRGSRRGGLPAPDLHAHGTGSADALLRGD
jgi:4-hydroxyphenylpyruvate dioxygenase